MVQRHSEARRQGSRLHHDHHALIWWTTVYHSIPWGSSVFFLERTYNGPSLIPNCFKSDSKWVQMDPNCESKVTKLLTLRPHAQTHLQWNITKCCSGVLQIIMYLFVVHEMASRHVYGFASAWPRILKESYIGFLSNANHWRRSQRKHRGRGEADLGASIWPLARQSIIAPYTGDAPYSERHQHSGPHVLIPGTSM